MLSIDAASPKDAFSGRAASRAGSASAVATICVFGSLILFAVRVRGEPAPISVALENLLLLFALGATLTARRLAWLLVVVAFLAVHRFATLPLVWSSSADLPIAFEILAVVSKCLVFAIVIHAIPLRLALSGTLVSASVMLAVFGGRLFLGLHIDPDNSFAGGMADRNYMALMLAFLLFAAVQMTRLLRSQGRSRERDELWISVLHFAALLLILRSGSRSGLLSCLLSLWLFSPRAALATLPLGLAVVATTNVASFLTERIDRLDTHSQEEFVRLAQLIAAWSRIQESPFGLITGFGVMASHHLAWFERGFAITGLDEYLTVIHNSLVDFLLGFGFVGVYFAARLARRLPLSTLVFYLAATSFINVLAFVPFYLAIAMTAKIGLKPVRPRKGRGRRVATAEAI